MASTVVSTGTERAHGQAVGGGTKKSIAGARKLAARDLGIFVFRKTRSQIDHSESTSVDAETARPFIPKGTLAAVSPQSTTPCFLTGGTGAANETMWVSVCGPAWSTWTKRVAQRPSSVVRSSSSTRGTATLANTHPTAASMAALRLL